MTRIFISYRRSDDPGSVGRVRDRLRDAYGEDAIFRDIEGIPKGTRFAEVIDKELELCTDLLVVIGPHWLDATDSAGARRLDNPDDWVRNEIEVGLARNDLQVVPVLVGGATLPRADQLPESIRPLLEWNASFLKEDSFDFDFDILVRSLGGRRRSRDKLLLLAIAAVLLVAVATAGFLLARSGDDSLKTTGESTDFSVPVSETDPPMTGGFNIAVAAFTSTDPANEDEAQRLAARLAERLQSELARDPAGPDIEVRGPDAIGLLEGNTPAERRAAAEALAESIDADLVIDGAVDFSDPTTIVPAALLSPSSLASSPELGGYYELGQISYPGTFTNQVTEEGLVAALTDATDALAHFVRGVSYYSILDAAVEYPDAAETAFKAALASPSLPLATQEAVHVFIGSLALLNRELTPAAISFGEALKLNPSSVRGRLGDAEVRLLQGNGERCAAGTVVGDLLTEAAELYAGIDTTELNAPSAATRATLGEARALRCRSQAGLGSDFEAAEELFRQVITEAGAERWLQELAASAHAELALTLAPPTGASDQAALSAALEAALDETRLAVESTDRHEPEYRWQEAFYLVQLGRDEEARAALAAATAINPDFGIVTVETMVSQATGRVVPSAEHAPAIVSRIPQLGYTD
ncbi:MAG: toll/interleukin-1 receptor domain-containing protein [Acidimicrobiales bacterium]